MRIPASPPSKMNNMKKIYYSILILFLCFFLVRCSKSSSSERGRPLTHKRIDKVAKGRIVIDGRAGDWSDIEPLTSEVGSTERGESPPKIDLKSIKAAYDDDNLYLLLEAADVGGGMAEICMDSDGNESTGVDLHLEDRKKEKVELQGGWDYVIKLTYSFQVTSTGQSRPMLISQVEKFKKVKYGYQTALAFEHKNSIDHPSYVGVKGRFQELRIPLQALNVQPPTDAAFLFMEGWTMDVEYDRHCQLIRIAIR